MIDLVETQPAFSVPIQIYLGDYQYNVACVDCTTKNEYEGNQLGPAASLTMQGVERKLELCRSESAL